MPSTMVVPFADNMNHHVIDSQYELFHSELHRECLDSEKLSEKAELYKTKAKMHINVNRFYSEDAVQSEVPFKTKRYSKKLELREEALKISPKEFVEDKQYQNVEIWDVPYMSTSDEEDNDSEEDLSSDQEQGEEEQEELQEQSKGIKKVLVQDSSLPLAAKPIKTHQNQRKSHVSYVYGGSEEQK